jgi:predicted nucleic acid-binding protein
MSVLVDTNVLLRRTQPGHPQHAIAVESTARLLATGEPVCFTPQNISEFWCVATRPVASNGMGFSVDFTRGEVGKIERVLTLLPDSAAMSAEWKRLVVAHNVLGSKVHDARLVAAMNVHGVRRILTFNTGDFTRYQVAALHPSDVLS